MIAGAFVFPVKYLLPHKLRLHVEDKYIAVLRNPGMAAIQYLSSDMRIFRHFHLYGPVD